MLVNHRFRELVGLTEDLLHPRRPFTYHYRGIVKPLDLTRVGDNDTSGAISIAVPKIATLGYVSDIGQRIVPSAC